MSALSVARSRGDRFVEVYNSFFYVAVFFAIAATMAYGLRNVRGTYLYFTLTDQQALPFFAGALLISSAAFACILYLLGPVAYSSSDLFWRFTGRLPVRNLWRRTDSWAVLASWGLVSTLLATIFAPFSAAWLVGTALATLLFGAVLMQGALGCQLLGRKLPLLLWAAGAFTLGVVVVLLTTTSLGAGVRLNLVPFLSGGWVLAAIVGSLALALRTARTPLEWRAATAAYGRSSTLLYALHNVGGPDGYRYYGSESSRTRRRLSSASAVRLSLAALADSLLPLILTALVSLPFAIFLGVGFGALGAGAAIALGTWAVASFYRWLTREWASHQALRQWLGAPYFRTLLGFASGSGVATAVYVLTMALVFQLPLQLALGGLLFGLAIALGEVNPPTQFNYDLTVTTIEGLTVPLEPIIAAAKTVGLLVGITASFMLGGAAPLLVPAALLVARTVQHLRSAR